MSTQPTTDRECPWPRQYYDQGKCCGQWPCIYDRSSEDIVREDRDEWDARLERNKPTICDWFRVSRTTHGPHAVWYCKSCGATKAPPAQCIPVWEVDK